MGLATYDPRYVGPGYRNAERPLLGRRAPPARGLCGHLWGDRRGAHSRSPLPATTRSAGAPTPASRAQCCTAASGRTRVPNRSEKLAWSSTWRNPEIPCRPSGGAARLAAERPRAATRTRDGCARDLPHPRARLRAASWRRDLVLIRTYVRISVKLRPAAAIAVDPILAAMPSLEADPVAIIGASGALGFGLAVRLARSGVPIAIGSPPRPR